MHFDNRNIWGEIRNIWGDKFSQICYNEDGQIDSTRLYFLYNLLGLYTFSKVPTSELGKGVYV